MSDCGNVQKVFVPSGGYPGSYEKGKVITGLDTVSGDDCYVVHAGTSLNSDDRVLSAGGRVLGVVSVDSELKTAIDKAYVAVDKIDFDGRYFRTDIGFKGV